MIMNKTENNKNYYLHIIIVLISIFICSYHFSWIGDASFQGEGTPILSILKRFIQGINSAYIPLFFMAIGALFANHNFDMKEHLKKIGLLIIKFWCARAITFFVIGLYNGLIQWNNLTVVDIINSIFFFGSFFGVDASHFWLIQVLIGIYIIYPLIDKTLKEEKNLTVFLGIIPLFFIFIILNEIATFSRLIPFINELKIHKLAEFSPFSGLIGSMLMYFVLGVLLHSYSYKFQQISFKKIFLFLFLGMTLLLLEWIINSNIKGANWDSVFNGYKTIATLIISCSLFILINKMTYLITIHDKIKNIIDSVNRNFLVIYYTHWIVGYTILPFIHRYIFFNLKGVIINYIKAILLILLISLLSDKVREFMVTIKIKLLNKKMIKEKLN